VGNRQEFEHRAIYRPGATSVMTVTALNPEGEERVMYSGSDISPEDYLAEANAGLKEGEEPYVLMPLADAREHLDSALDAQYVTPWAPITEEDWDYWLGVLPPEKWERVRGVSIFRVSEAVASNIYTHVARCGDACFLRQCRTDVPYEQLADEVQALLDPAKAEN
jgi:hypothetical protein